MSLNRALTEMFKAIREEAARNPDFAAKLGDAIAIHKPPRRKRVAGPAPARPKPFDLQESLAREPMAPAPGARDRADEAEAMAFAPAPALNPIAFLSHAGETALRQELSADVYSQNALEALVREHNLDPSGLAAGADKAGLIDQIVAQAKKRVERDKALFNY